MFSFRQWPHNFSVVAAVDWADTCPVLQLERLPKILKVLMILNLPLPLVFFLNVKIPHEVKRLSIQTQSDFSYLSLFLLDQKWKTVLWLKGEIWNLSFSTAASGRQKRRWSFCESCYLFKFCHFYSSADELWFCCVFALDFHAWTYKRS